MVQTRNRKSGKQSSETIITELPEPVSSSDRQQDVSFNFQGKQYSTYEEMVQAKRKRNNDYLKSSGLLDASAKVKEELSQTNGREASRRGLRADKKRKADLIRTTTRRKSNRLAGVQSDGIYVEEERGRGNFVIGGTIPNEIMSIDTSGVQVMKEEKQFFGNRVNDGSDLSVKEAVELSNPKWIKEDSLALANEFVSTLKSCHVDKKFGSPRSTVVETNADLLASQADNLSVDDENCVAKVVPDRIFSIAFHPSPHKLIAVAGDKKGHIGFWDVDNATNDNHGVHLFKPYNHPISNLEWFNNGTKLHSSAYDGSIRIFDVQKEVFTQSFATYDSSPEFKNKLGFGMEEGWMQFSCIDHRNENCIFYSTSYGDVVHLDLRQKGSVTCNANLSDKKINSISLHPSGNVLATGGLDCCVNIWDVRKMNSSTTAPIVTQHNSKSINSAFFSPNGMHLLTTTMADTLDIINDSHLMKGIIAKPDHRIRHNNRTGRWLSTFMAQWHPSASTDLFVVGSMMHPRTLQIFDASRGEVVRDVQGESLTAVVSRCCFHPSEQKLISAGGNSSGRVTVTR